jgi:uncharacterized membrane protein HdeD (DUF308 family)
MVSGRATGHDWWRLLQALLSLVIGLYLVLLPVDGAITLALLLVIWFVASGGLQLAAAYHLRGAPGVGWLVFGGALSVVLAVLIADNLPSSAAWAIGLLVGVNLVFWGVRGAGRRQPAQAGHREPRSGAADGWPASTLGQLTREGPRP